MTYFEDISASEKKAVKLQQPGDGSQMAAQVPYLLEQYSSIKKMNTSAQDVDSLPVFTIEDKKNAEEKAVIAKKLAAAGADGQSVDGGSKNEKEAIIAKKKLGENETPEQIAADRHERQQAQYAHNKKVFSEIDTDHNGRMSLKEIEAALKNPSDDLTKSDRVELKQRADQMIDNIFNSGHLFITPDLVRRQDVTRAQYLEQNRLVF